MGIHELTRIYLTETICADDKTAVSPSVFIQKTCFWTRFDRNVRPDPLPTTYLVPQQYEPILVVYNWKFQVETICLAKATKCAIINHCLEIWP